MQRKNITAKLEICITCHETITHGQEELEASVNKMKENRCISLKIMSVDSTMPRLFPCAYVQGDRQSPDAEDCQHTGLAEKIHFAGACGDHVNHCPAIVAVRCTDEGRRPHSSPAITPTGTIQSTKAGSCYHKDVQNIQPRQSAGTGASSP